LAVNIFCGVKKKPQKKKKTENLGNKKRKRGALILVPNTCRTIKARLPGLVACAHSCCCYSCGQALVLNAVIPAHFYAMFQLRKSKSFESERVTMSVTRVAKTLMTAAAPVSGSGYQ